MSDKEAVEAVHRAIADATDWWVGPNIARIALQAARPFLLEEAAQKEDARHRQWCIVRGRDPEKYVTMHSMAAAAIRAAKETGG